MDKKRVVFYFLWSVDDRNMFDPFSKVRNPFFRYATLPPKNHSNGYKPLILKIHTIKMRNMFY